jgi:hypothetical protein
MKVQPLSPDTTPEAQAVLFKLLRRAPVWKKLALTCDLIQTARSLALADLRRRYPLANEDELRRRMIARLLPREDVVCAYGFEPAQDED